MRDRAEMINMINFAQHTRESQSHAVYFSRAPLPHCEFAPPAHAQMLNAMLIICFYFLDGTVGAGWSQDRL